MTRSGLTLLLALVAVALMAPRPSVNQLNAEVNQNREVMCAGSDARGDTYRPFFCDPRCTCSVPSNLTSCTQTAPGSFEATSDPLDLCVPELHQCESFELCGPFGCSTASLCTSSSQVSCTSDSECPSGELCNPVSLESGICVRACNSASDCPATGNNVCESDPSTSCTTDTDCGVVTFTLDDVGPADAVDPATCDGFVPISSNDALECLAEVEAQTGPCS